MALLGAPSSSLRRLQAQRGGGAAGALAARRAGRAPRSKLVVQAYAGDARALLPSKIKIDRILGEGSFGQVFLGSYAAGGEEKVVLKRVKATVEGAAQMGQMELLLNVYASKTARNHCAEFIGWCQVSQEEATARLTPGLWIMWRYEGSRTLSYYLRRRDTLRALASDLEVPEEAVVATVLKQLLTGLAAFHAAGLVHRDVKPLNIIFAEQARRFKLIDLGACADLRTGTNYSPDESILDPNYCPPEQYVLPTDSPDLAKANLLSLAISPVLWAQHKPDRFDMWSAGVTMLQLAVPPMRQDRVLKRFNQDFGDKYAYDLDAWRAGSYISARDFEVLDADQGAGWELAKALLRPRSIRVLEDKSVVFVNQGGSAQRISAGEALRHRFVVRQAREPGCILDEGYSSAGSTSTCGSTSGSQTGGAGTAPGRRGTAAASAGGSNRRAAPQATPARPAGGGSAAARGAAPSAAGNSRQRRLGGGGGALSSGEEQAGGGGGGAGGQAGAFGAAVGLWRNLTSKLFDLEANIMVAASATERQSTVVQKLKQKAAKGQVPKEAVQQEARKLSAMEDQLSQLQDDFNSTATAVGNVLGFLGFGPTRADAPPTSPLSSSSSSGAGRASVKPAGSGKPAPSSSSSSSSSAPSAPAGGGGGGFFGGFPFGGGGSASVPKAPAPPDGARRGPAGAPPAPASSSPLASGTAGLWSALQSRLLDLEAKFNNQVVATERQTLTVRRLRQGIRTGQVDADTLERAEAVLQRMERRVGELDLDLKQTRQEATGLLGLLASSVGQVAGSLTGGSGTGASTPPPSSLSSSTSASGKGGSQPAAQGGGGGWWGGLFGMGGGGAAAGSAAGEGGVGGGGMMRVEAQGAPRGFTLSPSPGGGGGGGGSVAVAAAAGEREGSGSAVLATGAAVAEGAGSLIASSLKFTGMAAKVALGMAVAMKADAEKVLKEMEAEAEAKRARKVAEQAFLRMLANKTPPMTPASTYAEVEAGCGGDARFLVCGLAAHARPPTTKHGTVTQAVEAAQRPLLVASYVDALVQAQRRSEQQAQAKLRELLSVAVKPDTTWDEVSRRFGADPTFLAVADPAARRAAFDEAAAALRVAEEQRLAAGAAEQAFLDLLNELSPPVAPDSTWPRVKPLLWRDYRYLALAEGRRRALFDEMHAVVCEQARQEAEARAVKEAEGTASLAELVAAASAAADAALASPLRTSSSSSSSSASLAPGVPPAPAANLNLLEDLRRQQARLREEYQAMESKLREMEAALTTRQRTNQLLDETPAIPGVAAAPPAGERAAGGTARTSVAGGTSRVVVGGGGARRAAAAGGGGPDAAAAQGAGGGAVEGQEGGQSRLLRERAVAESLAAAGVGFTRMQDGTLVFTFGPEVAHGGGGNGNGAHGVVQANASSREGDGA